jgi:hypothetical protein
MRFLLNCVFLFIVLSSAYFDNEDYFFRRDIRLRTRNNIAARGFSNFRRSVYENKILLRDDLAFLRLMARTTPPSTAPPPYRWRNRVDPASNSNQPTGSGPNAAGPAPNTAGPGSNSAGPGPDAARPGYRYPLTGPGPHPPGTQENPGGVNTPNPNANTANASGKFACVQPGCTANPYNDKPVANQHFVAEHTTRARWKCPTCEYTSKFMAGLKDHMFQKHGVQSATVARSDGSSIPDSRYYHVNTVGRSRGG